MKMEFVRSCLSLFALVLSFKMQQICLSLNRWSACPAHICIKILAQLISIILKINYLDWIDQSLLQRIIFSPTYWPEPSAYEYLYKFAIKYLKFDIHILLIILVQTSDGSSLHPRGTKERKLYLQCN